MSWLHALLHFLGVDQGCPYGSWNAYNFFSGSGSDLGYLGVIAAVWHKHNCAEDRCWRIGRHVVGGTPWCDNHHGAARVRVATVTLTAGIGRKGAREAQD